MSTSTRLATTRDTVRTSISTPIYLRSALTRLLSRIHTATDAPLAPYRIKNPLLGIPEPQLMADVERFAREKELTDILPLLKRGALCAQNPTAFEDVKGLSPDELEVLRYEVTHKWKHPLALYVTIITCSIGAAVQ